MLGYAPVGLSLLLLLVAPSLFAWWRWRRLGPRPGSILDHARTLARHRLVAVLVILGVQLVLVAVVTGRPDESAPLPGHEHGPRLEAWLRATIPVAALSALVSLGATLCVLVVLARELWLVRRASGAAPDLGLPSPSPSLRRTLLGPLVSAVSALVGAALFFLDALLTLGD